MGDQRLNIHCPCSTLELVMYQRDEIGSRHMQIGDKISNDDVVISCAGPAPVLLLSLSCTGETRSGADTCESEVYLIMMML